MCMFVSSSVGCNPITISGSALGSSLLAPLLNHRSPSLTQSSIKRYNFFSQDNNNLNKYSGFKFIGNFCSLNFINHGGGCAPSILDFIIEV
ncbi:hypothetical protein BpHYR1_004967 [Brachionus plicatilis]|uniref:Uncharacterized protein n=1 Tax=Brachionus plicatilis TaxID=10195 RepID=A0A3M7RN98_BRAPC|nr:hypothetical protein BpHYR1_004967 [Brachionus plicatilis]